jgi:hypothetical protein
MGQLVAGLIFAEDANHMLVYQRALQDILRQLDGGL